MGIDQLKPVSAYDPTKLRVAQINAENLFLFFDKELPAGWRNLSEKEWQRLSSGSVTNKSLTKSLWLAQSLLEINADFVLVNEVGGEESLSNFARYFLDDLYRPHIVEGNSDRGIDVGYLVRKTVPVRVELQTHKNRPIHFLYPHEVQSNRFFETSAPEKVVRSHYFSRDCAELRVFSGASEKPVLIFLLVHLKSKLDPGGIDPGGRERRAAELRTLVEIYQEIRRLHDGKVPVIVGGDFNGVADHKDGETEFLPLFEKTDLQSIFHGLDRDLNHRMTQIQFHKSGQALLLQIDYLLTSPELQNFLVAEETFVYRYRSDLGVILGLPATLDQRLALPSDHYPVVATFKNFVKK